MSLITASQYLRYKGREFPEPDVNGSISYAQFLEADLPMVVTCARCQMTMVLHANRFVNKETGEIYCDECGDRSQHGGPTY